MVLTRGKGVKHPKNVADFIYGWPTRPQIDFTKFFTHPSAICALISFSSLRSPSRFSSLSSTDCSARVSSPVTSCLPGDYPQSRNTEQISQIVFGSAWNIFCCLRTFPASLSCSTWRTLMWDWMMSCPELTILRRVDLPSPFRPTIPYRRPYTRLSSADFSRTCRGK